MLDRWSHSAFIYLDLGYLPTTGNVSDYILVDSTTTYIETGTSNTCGEKLMAFVKDMRPCIKLFSFQNPISTVCIRSICCMVKLEMSSHGVKSFDWVYSDLLLYKMFLSSANGSFYFAITSMMNCQTGIKLNVGCVKMCFL